MEAQVIGNFAHLIPMGPISFGDGLPWRVFLRQESGESRTDGYSLLARNLFKRLARLVFGHKGLTT